LAAIVSGGALGLLDSSLFRLGAQGQVGIAAHGRAGERFYVNAATGNLYIQGQDEVLLGRGPDAALLRTYNSQGLLNDDNGDNWRLGLYRKVYGLTGSVNTAGSTVRRVDADGSEAVYGYDTGLGKYVSTAGSGAYDTLSYSAGSQTWTWDDGESTLAETYDGVNGGRLTAVTDESGNALTLVYGAGGLLSEVRTAGGEVTYLDYSGTNLTQLRTVNSAALTTVRTRYTYDASNRLIQVKTDLSPEDAAVADGRVYVTNYTYDGTSRRVATMTQSDGTSLAFQYVLVGADYRVSQISDALGRITGFVYDTATRTTTMTDPLGVATKLYYDAGGMLTGVQIPATGQLLSFAYDLQGNVSSVTDAKGNVVTYGYDGQGNRILERDAAGNTVTRVYSASNLLLAESSYQVPDPDGAGAGQPSAALTARYVYDAAGRLRFSVSAEGRVGEYRYNGFGQRVAAIQYAGNVYPLAGLTPTSTLTEAQLTAWLPADRSRTVRADMAYDFRGQVASTTSYAAVDAAGNGVADGTQAVTQFVYDQAGSLLKTIDARGTATPDPNDYTTSLVYDGMGRVLATTDALGRVMLTQYDDANRKTLVTLANGLVRTSTYDAAGQLVSMLEASGAQGLGETKYFYDADGRLRRTEDPTGVKTHVLYDAAGRKLAQIDGDGSLTEYRYDANGNVTRTLRYATAVGAAALASLTDAQGKPVEVALASIRPAASSADRSTWALYDSANRLRASVDAAGRVEQQFYDGASRLTDSVRFASTINVSALGDAPLLGAVLPASSPADRLARTFYDADSRVLGALDGEGYLLEYRYDPAGQLVETIAYATATNAALRATGTLGALRPAAIAADIHGYSLYNARGQVAGTLDGEGYLTETVYDAAGNKTQVIRYATRVSYAAGASLASLRPAGTAQDQVTGLEYNAAGQLVADTKPDGTRTTYVYDSAGNLVTSTTAVNTSEVRAVNARYDRQGRLTGELTGVGSALLTGGQTQAQVDQIWADHGIKHAYDAAGRRTSTTDALGNRTLFYYDPDGRLAYTINALGEVKRQVYNALGELVQSVQYGNRLLSATLATLNGGVADAAVSSAVSALADPLRDSLESYGYGAAGDLQLTVDPLGYQNALSYNAFGELVGRSQQIGSGQTLDHVYEYDKRGQLTRTRWDPAGLNTQSITQFDAFGRAVQTTDANGNVRTATYDKLGQVVATRDPLNAVRSTTYDAFGRTLTQTDALGNTTSFTYDMVNRSVRMTTPEGVAMTTVRNRHGEEISVTDGRGNVTGYQYDRNGNLTSVSAPASGTATSSYDRAGHLTETVDARGVRTTYSYDAAGRVLSRVVDPGGLALTTTYSYDAQGQAISVFDPNGVETRTSYDRKGQVVSVVVDPNGLRLETTYAYDGRGKKLSVTEAANTAQARLTEYSYDKLGRLVAERVDPAGLNLTTTYAYDKNGNVLAKTNANGNVVRYVYDAGDRPVYTIDPLGGVTRTEYDAEGRVARVISFANPINVAALPANPSPADIAVTADATRDRVTASVYDRDGRERFSVDALGAVVEKVYDAAGNVIRKIAYANAIPASTPLTVAGVQAALQPNSADEVVRILYDAANRPLDTIDATGAVVCSYYDANGNVTYTRAYANRISVSGDLTQAQLDALLVPSASDRITRHVYDAANRQVYAIDAESYVKETRYDGLGRITQTVQHPYRISVGATPTLAEVAAALGVAVPGGTVNQTTTQHANPVQPHNYVASANNDTFGTVTQNVALSEQNALVTRNPTQAYPYAATANNDVATPATQSVAVTSQSATVTIGLNQPYAYVGSAKVDTASSAGVTLGVSNATEFQSASIASNAYARSGSTIVQTAGLSVKPGNVSYGDATPTQVRATVYRVSDGVQVAQTYTDVGFSGTESWGVSYMYPTAFDENGNAFPVTYDENGNLQNWAWGTRTATGTRWNNVSNWGGQVNLTTGTLAPGHYRIVLETWDSAQTAQAEGAFYDYTDGTWAYSNTLSDVVIGTIVRPTVLSWAAATQPAGTATVSFGYKVAGSSAAYTSAAVTTAGTNQQASLAGLANGNYDYQIEYRNAAGQLLKYARGSFTSTQGAGSTVAASFTTLASSAAAGSSIRYFTAPAQWAPVERVSATVKDSFGNVVSTALTYPDAEASYNGEVNLKTGAVLADGNYTVELTLLNKNGTSTTVAPFTYEIGPSTRLQQTISWAASTQLPGTTPSFKYRPQGSTGAWSTAPVTTAGANQQVLLDFIPAGTYEYAVEYRDSYNRLLKSATSTFTVSSSGTTTTAVGFAYTAYTSTAGAGSSISGYIALAQVPTIASVQAVVTDFVSGATVSTALTYPEFEANYAGNVNLKVGSALAAGRYNVTVTINRKDGTSTSSTFYYEVGPQPVWYPTQPYAYVAAAKTDTASAAGVTLGVSNATEFQSASIANNAHALSGSTLVQVAGLSVKPGNVSYGDATPTLVRATVYRVSDGAQVLQTTTTVGSTATESWSVVYPTAFDENGNSYPMYDEYGNLDTAHWATRTALGTRWNGVSNWGGQVNLTTGSLAPDHYRIVLETADSAQVSRVENGFYDYTDATWAYSNTLSDVVIGTIVRPTVLSWAAATQPAGTATVSFGYKVAGSSAAYTSAAVTTAGTNQQASLAGLANGNYDYQIEYRNAAGQLLKYARGSFTSTQGSGSTVAASFTTLTSSAAAGSSIRYFTAPAQWAPVERVSATVKDSFGNVVSTALTYPDAEASYNGEVNLKTGAVLANGRYTVELSLLNKNGTTTTVAPFLYEVGEQTRLQHTISWAASTQPAATTVLFKYRPQGSTGSYSNAVVSTAGSNQQVLLDWIAAGTYQYAIEYRDSFNRLIKGANGTFTAATSGSTSSTAAFTYDGYSSTPSAGSSITGYIPLAQVPAIASVQAVVKDFVSGATVSTAVTYPEFEANYAGNVNLKVGAALANGRYNVTVTINNKDGTSTSNTFYYEVGPQPYAHRTTTVSWSAVNQPAGSTVEFSYGPVGQSTQTLAVPTFANGSYQVVFTQDNDDGVVTGLADGTYDYTVRYKVAGTVVREAHGQFVTQASGSVSSSVNFAQNTATELPRRVNTFAYDRAGRLIQSSDALGSAESYSYDALGNKTSFTNKNGARWTYGYDKAGRLVDEFSPAVAVTSTAGAVESGVSLRTRMQYDALGNVTARTEAYGRPEARTTQYQYDARGRQVRTTFPSINIYNPAADSAATSSGAAIARTEVAANLYSEVSYDTLGRAVVNRAADGTYSYKVYDQAGRLRYDIDAEHYVTEHRYDAFDNESATLRYAQRLSFTGHAEGTAWTAAQVGGAVSAGTQDRRIDKFYDRNNRLVEVREPQSYVYDSISNTGATAGRRTLSEYNAFGDVVRQRALSSVDALGNPVSWADTYFYFDERGRRAAQIDAEGYLTEWRYDASGNVIGQVEYAKHVAAGWSVAGYVKPPAGDADSGYDRTLAYGYDLADRKISETRIGAHFSELVDNNSVRDAPAADVTTTFGYDAVGNLVSATDAGGNTLYTYYDALGRTYAMAAPARQSTDPGRGGAIVRPLTVLGLDAFNKTVRQTNLANGAASANAAGFTAGAASAADQMSVTLYDSHGNVIQSTDAEGASSYFSYDAMGRVAKSWQPSTERNLAGAVVATQNSVQTFHYDALGNQLATVDRSTRRNYLDPAYPAAGNLGITLSGGIAQSASFSPVYDENGNVIPPGSDENGNPTGSTWQPNNSVNASWGVNLAALGGGEVKVVITYNRVSGGATSLEFALGGGTTTGATLSWSDSHWTTGYGIASISTLSLSKKDAAGNWVLLHSGANGSASTLIGWQHSSTGTVSLAYRATPGAGWTPAPTLNFGAMGVADLRAAGAVEFEMRHASSDPTYVYQRGNASGGALGAHTLLSEQRASYNAFGEITAKSLDGRPTEYFEYDGAGRLWRSNQKDGVDKVFLYDVQGQATAQVTSLTADLKTYASAAAVDAATRAAGSAVRTETQYDRLERVVASELPASGALNPSIVRPPVAAPASAAGSVSHGPESYDEYGRGSPPGWTYDEDGNGTWSGIGYVSVNWTSLAGWGSGDIRVSANITTTQQGPRTLSESVGSSTQTSATLSAGSAQITGLSRVIVEKRAVGGAYVVVRDSAESNSRRITFASPTALAGDYAVFRYLRSGDVWKEIVRPPDFGSVSMVNTNGSGWTDGAYNYEIQYRHADNSVYATGTGTFTLSGGEATITPSGAQNQTIVPLIEQSLDRWGNVLSILDPRYGTDSNPTLAEWEKRYRYDEQNRLVSETGPLIAIHNEDNSSPTVRPVTRNFYDRLGNAIAMQDANADRADTDGDGIYEFASTARYNGGGQLTRRVHADGGVIDLEYDALGRQVGDWDARQYRTVRSYDREDRLTQITRPDGVTEQYRYDELGNRTWEKDGRGYWTGYAYDAAGRVLRSTRPNGQSTHTYYDQLGNKTREINANGEAQSWQYDRFGRNTSYVDLSGSVTTNTYNRLGLIESSSNWRSNSTYAYHVNGALKSVVNNALSPDNSAWWNQSTVYQYDAAGNRTRETFTKWGTLYSDAVVAFDALNRVTSVNDLRYNLTYTYDANGNRRRAIAGYYNNVGDFTTKDYWYKYDRMNRIVLSQGQWNGSAIVAGSQGTALSYDAAGNRASAAGASTGGAAETYLYDAVGRLVEIRRNGATASYRYYDAANNVTQLNTYNGGGALISYQQSGYDANGWQTYSNTYKRLYHTDGGGNNYVMDGLSSSVNYTGRNGLGQVLSYNVAVYNPHVVDWGNGNEDGSWNANVWLNNPHQYTNYYSYGYAKFGGAYKESIVYGSSSYFQPGTTTTRYDGNGNIYDVSDQFQGSNYRSFVTDQAGRILQKIQNGQTEYYFYGNDKPLGATGSNGSADFDFNYTPVSDDYPALTPGSVVVSAGETLRSIAQSSYGDGALWYLIADANGISSDAQLKVGMELKIPSRITNLHNTAETFRPYEPGKIIGDTTPTLPDPPPPPKKKGCGGLGMIVMVIVAVVAAYFIGPLALTLMEGAMGVGLGATMAAGALTGAAVSVVTQGVGIATGMQEGFNWRAVAVGALAGGITAGITGNIPGVQNPGAGALAPGLGSVPNAIIGNVVNQGVGILLGQQRKFSWASVAGAAIGAAVTAELSLKPGTPGAQAQNFAANFLGSFTGGVARSVLSGGKINVANIAADAFGNALGSAIVGELRAASEQTKRLNAYFDALERQDAELGALAMAAPDRVEPELSQVPMTQPDPNEEVAAKGVTPKPAMPPASDYAPAGQWITVQKGDALERIAGDKATFGATILANGLSDPNRILTGQELFVPNAGEYDRELALQAADDFYRRNASRSTGSTGQLGLGGEYGGAMAATTAQTTDERIVAEIVRNRSGFDLSGFSGKTASVYDSLLVGDAESRISIPGGTKFMPPAYGFGPLMFDETRMHVKSFGNISPGELFEGLVTEGLNKYLGYAPYSQMSQFTVRDMGPVREGQIYDVRIWPNGWADNGTIALTKWDADTSGLPTIRLSTMDTRGAFNRQDDILGEHTVSGRREITVEPAPDGGYYVVNRGVSRASALFVSDGEAIVDNLLFRSEGGAQNANWQRFMTGLGNKIESYGGTVGEKTAAVYRYPNLPTATTVTPYPGVKPIPVHSGRF
jgi:YD repeat-containing protein